MQSINFKSIDSTDFKTIKPLILLIYTTENKSIMNHNDKLILKRFKLENTPLYDMLNIFDDMLKDTHQTKEDINETIYLFFRRVYIEFNRKHNELKSNNENCKLNQKRFPYIEKIVTHIANLNNQFKDTESLNGSQYYLVNKVKEFEKKICITLNHHSTDNTKAEFKKEFAEVKMIAPFISQYIKILENNINRFLYKVNKVCNDTNMTQELFKEYKESCENLTLNLNKLKTDFTIEKEITKKDVSLTRQVEHKGPGD